MATDAKRQTLDSPAAPQAPASAEAVSPSAGATPYGHAVVTLARHYQAYLDAATSRYGLSGAHVPLLQFLWAKHSTETQNQIARELHVDKGTISRAVQAMVNAGLVIQHPCERDTRACTIELTQAGKDLEGPIRAIADGWADSVLDGVSEADRECLTSQLPRISERADELVAQARLDRSRYAARTTSEFRD